MTTYTVLLPKRSTNIDCLSLLFHSDSAFERDIGYDDEDDDDNLHYKFESRGLEVLAEKNNFTNFQMRQSYHETVYIGLTNIYLLS